MSKARYYKIALILLSMQMTTFGQNLILNGSFENNSCNPNASGSAYETLSNSTYNGLMSNSIAFGTSSNIDILKLNSGFCGAAEDGNWYLGLTSGGTDAFSFGLSTPIIQGSTYSLMFYSRTYYYYPGCPIKVGISTADTSFGNLIYTSSISLDTCQWVQSSLTFIAPINAQYLTVTCGGPNNTNTEWIHIDNFILDTGSIANTAEMNFNNDLKIFPNPANAVVTVEYKTQNEKCNLQLFDMLGNEIKNDKLEMRNGGSQIDVGSLSNGIYFVSLKTIGGISIKKIIVQH